MNLAKYKISLTDDLITELTDTSSGGDEDGIIVKAVKTDGSGEIIDINIINSGNLAPIDTSKPDTLDQENADGEIGNINPEEKAAMEIARQEIVDGKDTFESKGFESRNTISSFDKFLKS